MSAVIEFLSRSLSFILKACYQVTGNYGISIIIFTLFTKVILFPVNIFIQKNSIKMVQMQPQLDALKIKYIDNKDKLIDEQQALYKKNHYHSSVSIIPLICQLALVMGLLDVIYKPLTYLLKVGAADIALLSEWAKGLLGVGDLGKTAQIQVIRQVQSGQILPAGLTEGVAGVINSFDMRFLGLDLGVTPSLESGVAYLAIPLFAALSALLMCVVQNRINILQVTAAKWNRYGMTVFMMAFSAYFSFLVPAGVGLYWIFGNLLAIPSILVLNAVIPPRKYIDIEHLKRIQEQKRIQEEKYHKYHQKEKEDYKKFFRVKDMQLMFYSESAGFYKYFAGMIDYICENSDIQIHYVTSDPEDKILSDKREQLHSYYVSRDKYLIPLFMKLDCDICVMTVPDLEKYHIKRSRVRNDIEYIYVSHGMGSNNLTLRKGALDWYDTIYCVGPHAVSEIRETEELYHLKKKRVVEVGYTLLDDMLEEYQNSDHKPAASPKIMIAPSWQPENIIDLCVEELLDALAGSGYQVVLRPHPQQVRYQPELFSELKEKYRENKNIEIQTDFSLNSPVMEADLLITDWSGICWEYAFTTKRPVLFINTPMKVMNADYDKIQTVPMNIALRNVIGRNIEISELGSICEIVKEMLDNGAAYEKTITETLEKSIYNIGKSKIVSGRYIIRSLQGR
ncbi:MAG: membrane protein insertase YidC [Acetatifactor sp.]